MTGKYLLAAIVSVAGCACLGEPPLACNLNALTRAERPRHQQLTKLWQSATLERREVDDGYAFRVDTAKASLDDLAHWITFEHKCCPFFRFRLEVDEHSSVWLTLSGGRGVKAFLDAEFKQYQ